MPPGEPKTKPQSKPAEKNAVLAGHMDNFIHTFLYTLQFTEPRLSKSWDSLETTLQMGPLHYTYIAGRQISPLLQALDICHRPLDDAGIGQTITHNTPIPGSLSPTEGHDQLVPIASFHLGQNPLKHSSCQVHPAKSCSIVSRSWKV
jgi:hypothetical protein